MRSLLVVGSIITLIMYLFVTVYLMNSVIEILAIANCIPVPY
jgi:hypothetical protein